MKHVNTITRKPAQAMSVVEFSGLMTVFGQAITTLTNAFTFVLSAFGFPVVAQHQKATGKP